jgi:hypothetical protein
MKIAWTILLGFPREKEAWLRELSAIMPLLSHFQPPNHVNHIIFQKGSVYHNNPGDYGLTLEPVKSYEYAYPNSKGLVQDIAYTFEPVELAAKKSYYDVAGISEVYFQVVRAFHVWGHNFTVGCDRMQMFEYSDRIEIVDFRAIAIEHIYTLSGLLKEIYRDCKTPQKIDEVCKRYEKRYTAADMRDALDFLVNHYLVVSINGSILALATEGLKEYTYDSGISPLGVMRV